MSELIRRLQFFFHRRRLEEELAEEMAAHRDLAADQGSRFGNTLRLREEARDVWGWTWIDRLLQDLRYAARLLRKSPGFTLAAILLLAIGIGVNVAAFGFFNLIFFKPLPVRDPETLVRLEPRSPHEYATYMPYQEMAYLRQYSKTLSAVLASTSARMSLEGEEKPISVHFVSGNFFSELGATPFLGRLLNTAVDDSPSSQPVVVVSHAFWRRHFGADTGVVGKTFRLNGKPVSVVGVTGEEFSGLDLSSSDLWMALAEQPYLIHGSKMLVGFSHEDGVDTWGRMKVGLSAKVVQDELRGLAAQLYQQHPNDIWKGETINADSAGHARVSHGRSKGSGSPQGAWHEIYPIIAIVSALVLLILAVSCGNLGGLLLARSVAREREITIRISVGAGRARLIRQLFTESLLLAFLGSLAGLALAFVTLRGFMTVMEAPPWLKATPDWRVVVYSLSVGVLAAVLFGLTPSLQVARQRRRASILRSLLIGGQVAASCVLLIVSGLLVRALDHAMHFDPGFEYAHVALIEPDLESHGYTPETARAYLDELQSKLLQIPGVQSVALSSIPPLGGRVETTGTEMAGRPISIHVSRVSPSFFKTMGIPIQRGRALQKGETRALVVGESFARMGWPAKDALGGTFSADKIDYAVVGVVGTARVVERQNPDAVEAYFSMETENLPSAVVLVKTAGATEALLPAIKTAAKSIRPDVAPYTDLLKNSFRRQLETIQNSAFMVSALGAVALLIACLGIVGIVTYSVSQRTKEIGLRMALGAKPGHVLSIVLQQFGWTVIAGLLVGTVGAAALSQLLRRELYGISNLDPASYLIALVVFAVVAAVAAFLPARRALQIDPMKALRYD